MTWIPALHRLLAATCAPRRAWACRPRRGGSTAGRLLAMVCLVAGLAAACGSPSTEESPAGDGVEWVTNVAAGAAPDEGTTPRVNVAAASDLRGALEELRPALEGACQTAVTVTYGSSGQLSQQIAAGAPFALFLSADRQYPEQLAAKGRVAPGGLALYGRGRLALVVRDGLPVPGSPGALVDGPYRSIAIANPQHAPYGRAARQALERSGTLAAVETRLVIAENVRQALDYVETGNADAGLVALALIPPGARQAVHLVDAALHEPIEQAGAVIAGSGAERTARCLLQYLLDAPGQAVLQRYGFEPAGTP